MIRALVYAAIVGLVLFAGSVWRPLLADYFETQDEPAPYIAPGDTGVA